MQEQHMQSNLCLDQSSVSPLSGLVRQVWLSKITKITVMVSWCLCLYDPIQRPSHFDTFSYVPAVLPNNCIEAIALSKSRLFFKQI